MDGMNFYLLVHLDYMYVKQPCRAFQQKALHFERCQNEFVTESVNLKRKGTVERETFPRQPESVRLIKSHSSRGTLETEAGHARRALDDSEEINK